MRRFFDWFEGAMEPVKEFIVDNHNNIGFWVIVFFGAILISKFVYSELSRR